MIAMQHWSTFTSVELSFHRNIDLTLVALMENTGHELDTDTEKLIKREIAIP